MIAAMQAKNVEIVRVMIEGHDINVTQQEAEKLAKLIEEKLQ